MSCETHRQDALSKIVAAHPDQGLTAQGAERIYQAHKRRHPTATYESVGHLAQVVAQSQGAVSLDEAQTIYDAAQAIQDASAPKLTPLADWATVQRQRSRGAGQSADIVERWNTRIEPNGWQHDGEAGAEAYLRKYGKSIGTEKVIALAMRAEHAGFPDMAQGFWKKAYTLATGGHPPPAEAPAPAPTPAPSETTAAPSAAEAYCLKCGRKRRLNNPTAVFLSNGSAATKGQCAECGRTVQVMGRTSAHDTLPKPAKAAKAAPPIPPSDIAAAERALLRLNTRAPEEALALHDVASFMHTNANSFEALDRRYKPAKISEQYRNFLQDGVPLNRLTVGPTGAVLADTTGLPGYACATCGHEFWARPPHMGQPKRCPACGALPENYGAELSALTDDDLRAGLVGYDFQRPMSPQAATKLELVRAELAGRGYPDDTVERWARGETVTREGPLMAVLPEDQQAALRNELGEEYLARAISKHLLTPEQRRTLERLDLSVEDVLNGRVPADETPTVDHLLREWNVEAGEDLFTPMGGQLAVMQETIERVTASPRSDGVGGQLTATPDGEPAARSVLDTVAPPRPANVGRLAPKKPGTPQEHILGAVKLPPPDPYRSAVPAELGGRLAAPPDLNAFVPPISRQYEINAETEKALRTVSTALQTGDPTLYNFYIAGEPGVGKNTLMRQIAACIQHADADGVTRQGVPYHQLDVVEQTNFDDLIGGTVLENVDGVTVTRWKPGPIGAFLMHGTGVLAINEIVRQPKAATLLQSIMEDRELPIRTPDGGMVRVPIGDGIIIAMTGNPGSDRDPDRPGAAAFTRTIPIRMEDGAVEERARRAEINYLKRTGKASVVEPKAKARPEIMQRDYTLKTDPLQKEELKAAVEFLDEIKQLIQSRQVQARTGGGQPVAPGPRGLDRFIALGKGTGDWRHALEMLKLYCSQDRELYPDEWKLVQAAFDRKFALDENGAWRSSQRGR